MNKFDELSAMLDKRGSVVVSLVEARDAICICFALCPSCCSSPKLPARRVFSFEVE